MSTEGRGTTQRVAGLLEKLLIEFTKSRSRQSNDNALAESKNGAVVRKRFGYAHIPPRFALLINDFNQQRLNPYLNFHRRARESAALARSPR